VFFNLFNEAEPFAAILIAHGTHVLGRNSRPKADSGRGVLREGADSPSPPANGSGERCKLLQRGSGLIPDRKFILDLLRA